MLPADLEKKRSSTITVIAFSNILFNRKILDEKLTIIDSEEGTKRNGRDVCTFTRTKNGIVQKKSVDAPYGSILTLSYGGKARGLVFKKPPPVNKKKKIFPQQLSIHIFLRHRLHILLFPSCMTITGCRSEMDAVKAVKVFWKRYVSKIPGAWSLTQGSFPDFWFSTVMQNYNGSLGYMIDKIALNDLLNSQQFRGQLTSNYTNEGDIYVGIQFPKRDTPKSYLTLSFSPEEVVERKTGVIPYRSKTKKPKPLTFNVFSTSSITMSGSSYEDILYYYEFMKKIAHDYRHILEEQEFPGEGKVVRKVKSLETRKAS